MPLTVVCIPCFNEAARLDEAAFLRLAAEPELQVLFVDDGSKDATAERAREIAAKAGGRADVLVLPKNVGKGEAVRAGLNRALELGADLAGFADADLSTPVEEIARMVREARRSGRQVVIGARVKLLGTDIRRHAWRHYLGRVFQTAASVALDLPVYDSQCGMKLFRATDALRTALAAPFRSRWAFDVELFGRLLRGSADVQAVPRDEFLEVPLQVWHDVPGSKLRPTSALRAALDLAGVAIDMRRARPPR